MIMMLLIRMTISGDTITKHPWSRRHHHRDSSPRRRTVPRRLLERSRTKRHPRDFRGVKKVGNHTTPLKTTRRNRNHNRMAWWGVANKRLRPRQVRFVVVVDRTSYPKCPGDKVVIISIIIIILHNNNSSSSITGMPLGVRRLRRRVVGVR